jgi:hypothetical protein
VPATAEGSMTSRYELDPVVNTAGAGRRRDIGDLAVVSRQGA